MNWDGRKVLVTGAGGFIGSHLAEKLTESGADVRAMVHYNSAGSNGWLNQSPLCSDMEIVARDITDAGAVLDAMTDRDTVFHLAALIAIPYSYVAPASYIQTNVVGTLNVMEAARKLNTQRVIHTSTSEVYGTAISVPISEEHPLQGQSPYSASKIGADKLAESYFCSFDTPVTTVRPFNTFGPRQSTRAVLPTIITQCLQPDVETLKLGSLTPTRDLNFVANTVHGFIKAAESDAAVGQTVNIGSGREISIGDLADTIVRLVGRDVKIECDQQRIRPQKSEVERLLADNTLATKLLDWKPLFTLEEGLEQTIDWFRENLAGYRSDAYSI
jgi:NAD dependent epimerase/dehydratase